MVKVDKDKCIGCGLCAEICGKSFVMGDDGKAVAKQSAGGKDCKKEAAESCPVNAISL